MPDNSRTAKNDPLDLAAIAARVASLPIRREPSTLAPAAQRIRRFYPRSNEPWTPEEDALLRKAWKIDPDFKSLAPYFQRQPGAVRTRARNLGL